MTEKSKSDLQSALIEATARVASAYIQTRKPDSVDFKSLVAEVYEAFTALPLDHSLAVSVIQSDGNTARVSIEDSIQPDYLVCLEDGKRLKMLKRYLKTNYGITPEEYRKRWNLPASYPMVAPEYAKRRSQLAKDIGLGKEDMRMKRMKQAASAKRMIEEGAY